MDKRIKYAGVAAAMLLSIAPIITPITNVSAETITQATNTGVKSYLDFNFDVDEHGPASLGFYASTDGGDKKVWTQDLVYTSKVGQIDSVITPTINGYVPNFERIGFLRTSRGYSLITDLYYTKVGNVSTTSNSATGINFTFELARAAKVYDDNGNVTSQTLSNSTMWHVDQQKRINGVTYYRIATNEWVKASDGVIINIERRVVETKWQSALYNSFGQKISNRALAANTKWKYDRYAWINGKEMYRVATNEWLSRNDIARFF
ncbi:hypothetical protein EGT49_01980 [Companilactobacillus suantsaicola]|uniref:S-layer protein C-terminal domain-containing protein n=1 Tax=Companilactobacillus suantsaicola TaxID=2487723 RepID=A0A4Z0JP83_9LACO|nr:SLAP domain-containing protein [Companilactobacillus suantsaicola]TGD24904.1 hypothetical protein EGT49_01980 [Companilactobacillus suantsaicola]